MFELQGVKISVGGGKFRGGAEPHAEPLGLVKDDTSPYEQLGVEPQPERIARPIAPKTICGMK
jgi:hypothetical protein